MIQEEIARLTGKLVFQVDNRPLMAFEKRLFSVMEALGKFQSLANKKVTMKVDLDGRSLRAKVQQASAMKIKLSNVSVDTAALVEQGRKVQEMFAKTPINLKNVKVDVASLVQQKKFVRTLVGQMQVNLNAKVNSTLLTAEVKALVKTIESTTPIKLVAQVRTKGLVNQLRQAIRRAEAQVGAMKVNVKDPKLTLQVDRKHLQDQIRAIVSGVEYQIRVRVTNPQGGPVGGAGGGRGAGSHFGAGLAGGAMGFARGAIPGLGAAFAFSQMNTLNQQMQGQSLALSAITGSPQAGEEQKKWMEALADRIGLDVQATLPSYTKMLASGTTVGMSTQSVQNIFQGVAEYGRVMGLDKEAQKGSMRAIEQMMNKGQVMSEELKGQLAERMPGAISAMAEAAGFGKDPAAVAKLFKAMENGEVKSQAVLEKFAKILAERARAGGALEAAMLSTSAQQARMNNAWTKSVEVFSKGGFDKGMGSFFKAMADGMKDAEPLISSLGYAFNILVQPINALIRILGQLGKSWNDIAALVGLTGKELAVFTTGLGLMMMPLGGVITVISALALAIDDVLTYLRGGKSVFGDWVAGNDEARASLDSMVFAIDGLRAAWDDLQMAFEGSENPFADWKIDDALIQSLDYITQLIKSISAMISAVAQLKEGNYMDAAQTAGQGYLDLMSKHPLWQMGKAGREAIFGNEGNILLAGQNVLQDQRNRHSPTTAPPGQVAQGNSTTISAPVTLTVQVPPGAPMESPGDFQKRVETITQQVLRDAFGQVRAQQAEK